MFIADQLMKAVESEIQVPRFGRAAQAARDSKAAMQNAIAKAVMLDTENIVASYFGANRQVRKNAIAQASWPRFRAIITLLPSAFGEASRQRALAQRLSPATAHPAGQRGRRHASAEASWYRSRWPRPPRNWPVRCAVDLGAGPRNPTASPPAR